ncbi:MAG: antibiotic biosynthesis monooxygenase [Candidatus Bathyarchaeia archaeon]|jgi:heme-degrading monooxygenase HmoA
MIARIWHGITPESKSDEYHDYLMKTGVKDVGSKEGNLGVYVLRRVHDKRAEFLFVSLWESVDAIRKFAGSDIERAVYYPEDKEFLLELEPNVTHYEVLVRPQTAK